MEQKRLYVLPDGRRAENMKQGCEMMNIQSESFRRLVKRGVIRKEFINMSKSEEHGKDNVQQSC